MDHLIVKVFELRSVKVFVTACSSLACARPCGAPDLSAPVHSALPSSERAGFVVVHLSRAKAEHVLSSKDLVGVPVLVCE